MKSIVTFALALSWFLTLMLPTDARLNDRLNDIWNAIKNIYDAVDNDDEEVRVIIGYRNDTIKRDRLISKILSKIQSQFDSADAFAAVMKRSDLLALKNDPDIDYIEEDVMVYPDGETKLYGLDMVQATSLLIPAVPGATSACNDPSSFKIGIVDSGLAVNHPDIPCTDVTKSNTNCIGKEFGISSSDKWYNPISKYHGTHVAGTIGATALNNDGIQGVINDGKFCFIIGRVFGEADAGASMSNILKAVEWMVSMGANVINMSLGTETGTLTARSVMQKAYDKGVILVGASGNDGTNAQHYPASFTTVLSVAAVDENRNKAAFSQYNTGVDIAAPGVNILSTSPLGSGGVTLLSSSTVAVVGDYMKYAVKANVTGVLADCPNFGVSACPGPGKHVCLIKRGINDFEAKAQNCKAGGGIGAVVYNNAPGKISGGLSSKTKLKIPVLEVSQLDGQLLRSNAINVTLAVTTRKGYRYLSGTSMACPHVAGIAAKIWRICRKCTNAQVIQCIQETAVDLGKKGRDDNFGAGLIQAEPAYNCLLNRIGCCG